MKTSSTSPLEQEGQIEERASIIGMQEYMEAANTTILAGPDSQTIPIPVGATHVLLFAAPGGGGGGGGGGCDNDSGKLDNGKPRPAAGGGGGGSGAVPISLGPVAIPPGTSNLILSIGSGGNGGTGGKGRYKYEDGNPGESGTDTKVFFDNQLILHLRGAAGGFGGHRQAFSDSGKRQGTKETSGSGGRGGQTREVPGQVFTKGGDGGRQLAKGGQMRGDSSVAAPGGQSGRAQKEFGGPGGGGGGGWQAGGNGGKAQSGTRDDGYPGDPGKLSAGGGGGSGGDDHGRGGSGGDGGDGFVAFSFLSATQESDVSG